MRVGDNKLIFLSNRTIDLTIIDLEHIKSIGGWKFLDSITPLILKSSRDYMRRIIFCHEELNYRGMRNSLGKLQGTANVIGALRLIRCIQAIQSLVDAKSENMKDDMEALVDAYNEIEALLSSEDVEKAILGEQAS
jgi:hypothetical protein